MISLVAAISKNNCIGKGNTLPWDIPEDMEHMRRLTLGKTLIMGRKTWESIPEKRRPLPKRTNIVITRDKDYPVPEGVFVYPSVEEALEAHKGEDIVSFGGQKIFFDTIDLADTLYITHVDMDIDACEAFFPEIDMNIWREVERDDRDGFSFVTYKKR